MIFIKSDKLHIVVSRQQICFVTSMSFAAGHHWVINVKSQICHFDVQHNLGFGIKFHVSFVSVARPILAHRITHRMGPHR